MAREHSRVFVVERGAHVQEGPPSCWVFEQTALEAAAGTLLLPIETAVFYVTGLA
jgi:hypothetical protein